MNKVIVDRSHALVNVVADGFFGEEELTHGVQQLHAAIASLGHRAGHHVTLYDLLGLKVVHGPVLARFASYFSDPVYRPIWARRVAFLTTSALVLRQMSRVVQGRADMALFDRRVDAIAWLLAAEDRGAVAA